MAMEADHIVMSPGCVRMAIKPGSTSLYMWKTHFPEQQDQEMRIIVTKKCRFAEQNLSSKSGLTSSVLSQVQICFICTIGFQILLGA